MAPVLVRGESGTGKELVARAIHACQPRSDGAVRRGQLRRDSREAARGRVLRLPQGRLHRRRTKTAKASSRRRSGGTLFLDEIGDLPLAMQSQAAARDPGAHGAAGRRGRSETPVDVRIVSATHKDLGAEVQAGRFRQDLFYRLNVIQIRVPALRERLEDLAAHLRARARAHRARRRHLAGADAVARGAGAAVGAIRFPGNVRELENLLHRAVALSAAR